jgi:fatty acid desaturase
MALEIVHDPRIRSVPWADLVGLSRWEVVKELVLPVPFLALSCLLAHHELLIPALLASFVFFLTGLRLVHNGYHYALGLPRFACECVMAVLSIVMLGSMHAIQFHHLRHHKHCLDDEDIEGIGASGNAWWALAKGPWFPIRLHLTALAWSGARVRRWIMAELLANAAWLWLVMAVCEVPFLKSHVLAMAVGRCLTAFFAVWTVHHDCERSHFIARTLRRPFVNLVSFNMFYHVEHHLFPRVPTCHLPQLAKRLDQAAPELKTMAVM